MKRNVYIVFLALTLVIPAFAHEYWLEPGSFFLKPKESTPVRLFLGEGLKVEEEMPFLTSKTNSFNLYSGAGRFDLLKDDRDEEKPLFSFSADREGTYLLSMERNWSYITLEAQKFEDYLREDGMEYIITERENAGESKMEGKERYSRYIKALVQVGGKRDKTFAKRAGLRLEIVPLLNPYSLKVGDSLPVQIFFEGKPLAGRTLFADNRGGDKISKQKLVTDRDGKTTVELDGKGVWLIRLVYMQRCKNACEGTAWESFWGALSFGMR